MNYELRHLDTVSPERVISFPALSFPCFRSPHTATGRSKAGISVKQKEKSI